MNGGIRKAIIIYTAACVIGTALVVFVAPFVKAHKINTRLKHAKYQLQSGDPAIALGNLQQLRSPSAIYPCLSACVSDMLIEAYIALNMYAEAEELALDILSHRGPVQRSAVGLWEHLQILPISIINSTGNQRNSNCLSSMRGCETLVSLLKKQKNNIEIERVAISILDRDPDNSLALTLRQEISEAATTMPQVVTIQNDAEEKKPHKELIDHYALARKYASARDWENARQECTRAIEQDPGNKQCRALMERIKIGDAKWAIVKTPEASAYTIEGKYVRKIPAGTFLEINELKNSRNGTLAVCTLSDDDKNMSDIVVRSRDLHIRFGILSNLSKSERALYLKETQLMTRIDAFKANLLSTGAKNNPHAVEYANIKEEYSRYWKKVEALTEKRDKSSGEDHVKYSDELRKMKGDDIRLGQTFESAKKRYDDWNMLNASSSNSSELASLQAELDSVVSALRSRR
ncbi:MAG: hypothetical protein JXN60_00960 [Lentisphaerae bacterium]|nr:hypothetical protein [Lentisphaerota bacterium]